MFKIDTEKYSLIVHAPGLPDLFTSYVKHATLVDQIELKRDEGTAAFLAVGKPNDWPFLVVAQRCIPGENSGFHPGALIVPETDTLFIGAGERILAYNLKEPSRLWEDSAEIGFWAWDRYRDFILMSAELEFAAWDIQANKLWTTFVEPPWSYTIEDRIVHLEVMGNASQFPINIGP